MDSTEIIGLIAAALTTISLIPQVVTVIKTRNTSSISLGMYSLYTAGTTMWLTYGILSGQLPIIASNGIGVVLAAIILSYKLRESGQDAK